MKTRDWEISTKFLFYFILVRTEDPGMFMLSDTRSKPEVKRLVSDGKCRFGRQSD